MDNVSTLGLYIHNILQQLNRLSFQFKIVEKNGQLMGFKHEKLIFAVNSEFSVFCMI